MFPCFIGINEKFLNLQNVAMIEDRSTEDESVAVIIIAGGDEIELVGSDADLLFERADLFAAATVQAVNALMTAGGQKQ